MILTESANILTRVWGLAVGGGGWGGGGGASRNTLSPASIPNIGITYFR